MQLEYVLDVGVIGVPDPLKGEAIKAFVVLKQSTSPVGTDEEIALRIRSHVRANLSKHLAPASVQIAESLPKTESGKIKRFVLRQL